MKRFIAIITSLLLAGCLGRPNVTNYMKQQESSLAVQRCLERFVYLTNSRTISVDFNVDVIGRSTENNSSGVPMPILSIEAGIELCMALYFDDTTTGEN